MDIIRKVALIIFCLFIYSSGQVEHTLFKISSTGVTEYSEEMCFVSDVSAETPSFIEEESEENDKSLHRFFGITLLEKKIHQTFLISDYKNNEILPVVILVQQTNLPPPVSISA